MNCITKCDKCQKKGRFLLITSFTVESVIINLCRWCYSIRNANRIAKAKGFKEHIDYHKETRILNERIQDLTRTRQEAVCPKIYLKLSKAIWGLEARTRKLRQEYYGIREEI